MVQAIGIPFIGHFWRGPSSLTPRSEARRFVSTHRWWPPARPGTSHDIPSADATPDR
jgi:hypothetical protein